MLLQPGNTFRFGFTTSNSSGVATNADATPTIICNHNGSDDSSVICTLSNPDSGRYIVTGTIPSGYATGDILIIFVVATVGGVGPAKTTIGEPILIGPTSASSIAAALAPLLVVSLPPVLGVPVIVTTVQGGATNTSFIGDSSLSAEDGAYVGSWAILVATGTDQASRNINGVKTLVTAYTGATKTFTHNGWPGGIVPPPNTAISLV